MSLVLNQSTRPEVIVKTFDPKKVFINVNGPDGSAAAEISAADFVALVEYVLTNTDLEGRDDYRFQLVERIVRAKLVPGWNEGGRRITLDKGQLALEP